MNTNIVYVLCITIAFVVGLFFQKIWVLFTIFFQNGINEFKKGKQQTSISNSRNAKLISSLFGLLALSIASWTFSYYVSTENLYPFWREVSNAIFGVSTAGLLGGIVFEAFLRQEILNKVNESLAQIITLDKSIASEIFTKEKRNQIVESMIQINSGNDVYGTAIFDGLVKPYVTDILGKRVEFRYDFKDHLILSMIDEKHGKLAENYYELIDSISYRSEPRSDELIIACASNEDQLDELFSDPICIYRWMIKSDEFENLIKSDSFVASLFIDGEQWEIANGKGEFTKRGFELRFKNTPEKVVNKGIYEKQYGKLSNYEINIRTLQSREQKSRAVQIAYPVKGVEISFDYEKTNIQNVSRIHYFSSSKYPKIDTGLEFSKSEQKRKKLTLSVSDEDWIFPNSGVSFNW